MLRTRAAANPAQVLRYAHQAAERIQLPWLCPALAQSRPWRPQRRTVATRPSISRAKTSPLPVTQSRHLASPATLPESYDRSDDYIPFAYGSSAAQTLFPPRNADLEAFDLSQILMLDHAEEAVNTSDEPALRTADEIESNIEACVQVHRWDRAITLLHQLTCHCQNNPVRLRYAFDHVFSSMVEDLLRNRNTEHEIRINEWIEVHMKQAGLEPDAQTLALKLKVALETKSGHQRDRTVQRYWEMTRSHGLESKVLSLRDILNDKDLGRLSQICTLEVSSTPFGTDDPLPDGPNEAVAELPEVSIRETEQKGLGLSSLKQSLAVFSEQAEATETEEDPLTKRQRRLERDAIKVALERWKAEFQKRASMGVLPTDLGHGAIGALMWQWHKIMADKITKEVELGRQEDHLIGQQTAQQKLRAECTPFLELLAPEHVAAITSIALVQIMSRVGASKQISLVRLVTMLGQTLENECNATNIIRSKKEWQKAKKTTQQPVSEEPHGNFFRLSTHHSAQSINVHRDWTRTLQGKIGAVLCELMFDTARIMVKRKDLKTGTILSIAQPVFIHTTAYRNGRKLGVVNLHEDFVKILISEPAEHLVAKQLPMVSQPVPWTGFLQGGYLESKQPFLRIKHNETAQRDYAITAAGRGDLDQLFAGVDVLGRTGWRINNDVFSVMAEAWNSGEEVANIPPLNKEFPQIERPGENASTKDRYFWYSKMRAVDNEKSGLHSNRCFQNFQMEIAKAYRDETFYLPHNVDFRGRAYPIPPYLNQMGADNCRGLLLFDEGRELGEGGLRWLKIHLSNVFGYDKASLADRAQFPIDHLDEIYDSVRKPLDGKRWWLTAEDPWQCLAACFELTKALECADPTKFVSRLPVHQDGSCNGLQHYAALGGDIAGARQVNLEPGDKPADVYSGVCELVKAEIKDDAANGNPLAKMLDGRVTRKVVKQTVMTNVYGVTFLGAIRQVRKQVEDLIPEVHSAGLSGTASSYIARKIFKGLGTLFTGAHDIQYWLGDCANRISSSISPAQLEKVYDAVYSKQPKTRSDRKKDKSKDTLESAIFRSPVIWTTPLKLPVVQPYRVNKGSVIHTNLQNISLAQPSVADSVDKRKQLQAFPPNFIHSLDATHMILSALKANELGLSFAAVHDSFWTHAADVDRLNELLRDAFIRMHSDDIIGRLAAEFNKRYDGHYYLASVYKASPLGKAIAEHRQQLVEEKVVPAEYKAPQLLRQHDLAREIRKKRLLQSEDAAEQAEGAKMVTAATLFEQMGGEKCLVNKDSLGETAIGMVPETAETATPEVLDEAINASDDVDLSSSLDPLRDAEPAPTPTLNVLGQKVPKKKKQQSQKPPEQVWLWLPIKFRPVPKKGDFDVRRLRESTYFFS